MKGEVLANRQMLKGQVIPFSEENSCAQALGGFVYVCVSVRERQQAGSSGNGSDMYSEGDQFKSQLEHWLFRQMSA
jgi:hypothetical protein